MHPHYRKAIFAYFFAVSFFLIRNHHPNVKNKSVKQEMLAPKVVFEGGLNRVIPERRPVYEEEDDDKDRKPIPISMDLCVDYDLCDSRMKQIIFNANLPNRIRMGDKIRLKGTVIGDAKQFSNNLVNQDQHYITYHLELHLVGDTILENWKIAGEWGEQKTKQYRGLDGAAFYLEFEFLDEAISVYERKGDSLKFITKFVPEIALDLVESVRVWGDVEEVTDFILSYA